MDKEKIQKLRLNIDIPLTKAIELLKLTDSDIERAERLFHEQQIDFIVEKTDCVRSIAEEFYQNYNGDWEKAVNKIKSILHFQKIHKIFDFIGDCHYGAGYRIFGVDENSQELDIEDNITFLPLEDFRLIQSAFEDVFPVYNLRLEEIEVYFDPFFANTFDRPTCQQISQNIRQLKHDDERVLQFFQDVSDWLNERLIYAHHVVVEGNL